MKDEVAKLNVKIDEEMNAKFRGMEDSFKQMLAEAVSSIREDGSSASKRVHQAETIAANRDGGANRDRGTSATGASRGHEVHQSATTFQRGENVNFLVHGPNQRHVKLEFPKFKQGDPTSWVSKAKQYFAYQEIPLDRRVNFASYHLEDEANEWWQATSKILGEEGIPVTWEVFEEELWARFGPTAAEDFDEALSKIKQTGSLCEY